MPYIIVLIIIMFVLTIAVCTAKANNNLKNKIFKLQNSFRKINCVQSLTKLIEKKLTKELNIISFISKEKFQKLNLIEAPIYLINAKYLGNTHLKFFCRALESVTVNMNFVVLDGVAIVNNNKVNVVMINSKDMTLQDIAIFNKLNVNAKDSATFNIISSKPTKSYLLGKVHYLNNSSEILTQNDCVEEFAIFNLAKYQTEYDILYEGDYVLSLPKNPLGYIVKGKQNKVCVFNVFGEKIFEIYGRFSSTYHACTICIRIKRPGKILLKVYYDNITYDNLQLLNFDISYCNFTEKCKKIKEKALIEIAQNPFLPFDKIEPIKFDLLDDFFKVANMRKKYYNDYIFLLSSIFGISVKNSVLKAKPNRLVTTDFSVLYKINNQDYDVKYCFASDDKVKLSRVGHKLGVKENFAYDF